MFDEAKCNVELEDVEPGIFLECLRVMRIKLVLYFHQ